MQDIPDQYTAKIEGAPPARKRLIMDYDTKQRELYRCIQVIMEITEAPPAAFAWFEKSNFVKFDGEVLTICEQIAWKKPRKSKNIGKVTLDVWLEHKKATGEKAIPEDDPVVKYAEEVGISKPYLRLAWLVFKDNYMGNSKRYTDWREVFRKSVKGSWFKLWAINGEDQYFLTTVGKQAAKKYGLE